MARCLPQPSARQGLLPTLAVWAVVGMMAAISLTFVAAPGGFAGAAASHRPTGFDPRVSPAVVHPANNTTNATLFNVTFNEHRLPNGSSWSVTAANATKTNTTSGKRGDIVFQVPNGTLSYVIGAPSGFGVAKIEGAGQPSQTSDLINGTTTLTVFFAPIVNLTFNESGLPSGATWGISIHSSLPHGGPSAPANQTSNGTSITFQVVKGTWKFVVTPIPAGFQAMPAKGAVGTGHDAAKVIRFHQEHGVAIFNETGLAPHTVWQVNLTGPVTVNGSSDSSVIRFHLPAGTYTFTIWNFSTVHPTPLTGTITVSGHGATATESITYA